jgi:Amt family ammonium transporter
MVAKMFLAVCGLLLAGTAYADKMDDMQAAMDTVWIVAAGSLVFFMQAGFALLETGMARSKNAVNVIMKNYTDACVGTLAFWMIGFGLMFGNNPSGWIGTDHFFMNEAEPMHFNLMFFQTMFAATSITIASGAMAERTKFEGYLMGALGIGLIIYPIFGSWVWGGMFGGSGWLAKLGFIDFAGSTVVHSIGGWCALAGIMVLGPRLGRFSEMGEPRTIPGHNLTFMALGGFILWVGWFGFNGGSTVSAKVEIGLINLNTQLAGAAGALSVILFSKLFGKPVLATTTVNGGIGGLVAITAGCATMVPQYAIITGVLAGLFLMLGMKILESMKLDDVVGAVSVHGICGAWGTLAAGLFLKDNMFSLDQVVVQLFGIVAAFIWAMPTALLMYFVIDKTIVLRVSSIDERRGLDFTEHYELGYPEFQDQLLHKKME